MPYWILLLVLLAFSVVAACTETSKKNIDQTYNDNIEHHMERTHNYQSQCKRYSLTINQCIDRIETFYHDSLLFLSVDIKVNDDSIPFHMNEIIFGDTPSQKDSRIAVFLFNEYGYAYSHLFKKVTPSKVKFYLSMDAIPFFNEAKLNIAIDYEGHIKHQFIPTEYPKMQPEILFIIEQPENLLKNMKQYNTKHQIMSDKWLKQHNYEHLITYKL